MLQQTQADRVIPRYEQFLERFPSMRSLARARFRAVMRAWLGLGYNSRALRLWQCARIVMRRHHGNLPHSVEALQSLPGIGPYTAAAVNAIAFDGATYGVDVNVRRVLTRALLGRERMSQKALLALAQTAAHKPTRNWMQALMDIGALHCTARPQCGSCPLRKQCAFVRKSNHGGAAATRRSTRFVGSTRFYRGRVVAALTRKGALKLDELGKQVKHGFGKSDAAWLAELLQGLVHDGLIRIHARPRRVMLA